MMEIALSRGKVAVIDDADYPLVAPYKWYARRTYGKRRTIRWYASTNVPRNEGSGKRRTIDMHRVILSPEPGREVDHEDGDGLNNRRSNISAVSHIANMRNQHAVRSRSGKMGVYASQKGRTKPWTARIEKNGKKLFLGRFDTKEEASAAYEHARRESRLEALAV